MADERDKLAAGIQRVVSEHRSIGYGTDDVILSGDKSCTIKIAAHRNFAGAEPPR